MMAVKTKSKAKTVSALLTTVRVLASRMPSGVLRQWKPCYTAIREIATPNTTDLINPFTTS